MKRIFTVLALWLCAAVWMSSSWPSSAQANIPITVTTYADLTGNGAAQQVASSGTCRWVQFVALSANSAAVRIGDSNIGASRGTPVAAGGGYVPLVPTNINYVYSLSGWYFYAASGDKVSMTCGN